MGTPTTNKLKEKHDSPKVQQFKKDVLDFFEKGNVRPEICYKICIDLSAKMDMPFYHEKRIGKKSKISCEECAQEYIKYLIQYNNYSFSEKLINEYLFQQQNQTFRKIHRRPPKQKARAKAFKLSGKEIVWEHPIPSNYSKKMFLSFVKSKDYEKACDFIIFLSKIPQIALLKETENKKVNSLFNDSMPENWNWEKDDPFIRYVLADIDPKIYRD
ncbi:MAG: hypothetical protein IK114_03845 [Fibrobacter sp.]|nr:hypothetical protein [Fibrobacter sp.]